MARTGFIQHLSREDAEALGARLRQLRQPDSLGHLVAAMGDAFQEGVDAGEEAGQEREDRRTSSKVGGGTTSRVDSAAASSVDRGAGAGTDLHQLLRAAAALKPPNRVKLCLDLTSERPWIQAPRERLEQIIMHLLLNAYEALGGGEGTVTLRTASHHGRCILEVTDSGCGIAGEHLGHIFAPWHTTKAPGRGHGLPTVLSILRGLGGGIWVTSAPGAGSCFKVSLPAA